MKPRLLLVISPSSRNSLSAISKYSTALDSAEVHGMPGVERCSPAYASLLFRDAAVRGGQYRPLGVFPAARVPSVLYVPLRPQLGTGEFPRTGQLLPTGLLPLTHDHSLVAGSNFHSR